MFKHKQYLLSDIIKFVVNNNFKEDDFCIYGNDNVPLNLIDKYLVSDYPEVVNNQDIYPDDVRKETLNLIYYGEEFVDVIFSALEQKQEVSNEELLDALIFYSKNDNFITFNK